MNDAAIITASMHSSADYFLEAAALHNIGKFLEAEAILRKALTLDPNNSDLWNARGVMFAAMDQYANAVRCYREAIARNPKGSGIWTNLGNALTNLRHLKSAVLCHRRAIALSPQSNALLYHNLGTSLAKAGHHGEAVAAFSQALEIKPDHHMARWDRGLSYLSLGNYKKGWADYEVRTISGQLPARELLGKKWKGEPYSGKRLFIAVEQGFGDTIWAARYFSRIKALGGELVVECQRELIPLIDEMKVVDRFISRDDPFPEADLYCHTCSLPGLFTNDFDAIPAQPYLSAPKDRIEKFQSVFANAKNHLKVGIVWSGSVTFKNNHERAQRLVRFMQAFNMPGLQLYSLQKGPPEQAISKLPAGARIIDLAPMLQDFSDTAAAISQLDLIIMTDSAVAHLAGSMGKPVWVLLSHSAHWLWLTERADCPWYPSIRLFRPRAPGDWDHVFDTAAVELMNLTESRS